MSGLLKITDGTRSVTMLANLTGIFTDSWVPQSSQAKNGGTWAESPFTDGRQLVIRNRSNIVDTFELILKGGDQDISIANAKTLIALLESALNYWLDEWQVGTHAKPVWIEYRGDCETETSYAYIYEYSWPALSNPHDNPFRGGTADELTLILEHGEWRGNAPGTSNSTLIYATDGALNGTEAIGTSSAQASSLLPEHFATLKYVNATLALVYRWDNSAATYTDIINPVAAENLFNIPVQVNDAVYIGSRDFPFDNVIFTFSQLGNGTVTMQLEYYNGVGWAAVPSITGVPEFEPSGIFGGGLAGTYALTWQRIADWATNVVNGNLCYWVRIRVTVVAVPPALVPIQGPKPIYTVTWPWIEFDDDQIPGDLPGLLKFYLGQIAHVGTIHSYDKGQCSSIVLGAWDMNRGNSFTGYLECSLNKAGVTVFGSGAATASSISPSTVKRLWAAGGAASNFNIVEWQITTNPEHWLGEFRVFVRYLYTSGVKANLWVNAYANANSIGSVRTEKQYTSTTTAGATYVLDLGTINISVPCGETPSQVVISVYGDVAAAATLAVIDLVLVPIDDFSIQIDCEGGTYGSSNLLESSTYDNLFAHNSTCPKSGAYTIQRLITSYFPLVIGNLYAPNTTKVLGNACVKPNTHYRIFHFGWFKETTGELFGNIDGTFADRFESVSQYIFARGTE